MKTVFPLVCILLFSRMMLGQSLNEIRTNLTDLEQIPGVTGHEQPIAAFIAAQLKNRGLSPQVDGMSNVTVTLGSGKPRRLLIANLDEPGFIVSGITDDGFLRMQRIGNPKPFAFYDQYFEGQRVVIRTAAKAVTGVVAIPSTHLARGTARPERAFDLSDGYVDVGLKSAEEVTGLGIHLLDPISIEKTITSLAHDQISAPFLSDRAGVSVLLSILMTTPGSQINGTVTFAFASQEHFQRKGLDRMTLLLQPDEVYVLEPRNVSQPQMTSADIHSVAVDAQAAPAVKKMLDRFDGIREATLQTAQTGWRSETNVVRIGIPILFYATPVEVLDLKTMQSTIRFLRTIVQSGVS